MKVLKPGDPEKIEAMKHTKMPTRNVICKACDCVFEVDMYDKNDCHWDYYDDQMIATCPCPTL